MGFPRLTRRKDAEDYKEPQEFLISLSKNVKFRYGRCVETH